MSAQYDIDHTVSRKEAQLALNLIGENSEILASGEWVVKYDGKEEKIFLIVVDLQPTGEGLKKIIENYLPTAQLAGFNEEQLSIATSTSKVAIDFMSANSAKDA